MQTDRIAVALRPRDGWESIDLGFRMVRAWWRPLFGAWLLVVWPLAIATHALLFEYPLLAAALFWWGKPVYDRIALHVLGGALFGETPRVRDTLRALPRLLRSGLLGSLTWLRASPLRSVQLPVIQLEQLRGSARVERTRILVGRDARVALGLHLACLHFELILFAGMAQSVSLLAPEVPGAGEFGGLLGGGLPLGGLVTSGLYVIAVTLVEPFYLAGGFALYINRRIYLEGWDIDLAFRRLSERARASAGARRAGSLALSLALVVSLGAAAEAAAQERETPPALECEPQPEAASECIERVLAASEFATTRDISFWWPKGWDQEEEEERGESTVSALIEVLARLVRGLGWLALAVAIGALAYWIARTYRGHDAGDDERDDDSGDVTRLGPEEGPVPLPDAPVAAAREHWRAGEAAAALGLLYRAALRHLARDRGLDVPPGATEDECERIATRHLDASLAADFASLTIAWQYCAYARRPPDDGSFHALCESWQPRLEAPS